MEDSFAPLLWIIVPCYNEGSAGNNCLKQTHPDFINALNDLINRGKVSPSSSILYINDGSTDDTWEIIKNFSISDPHIAGICLSSNKGHQYALLAGLLEANGNCDISVTIDCDGQDDINAIEKMVEAYNDGSDVVFGVRSARQSDKFFKRFSAESFYKLLNKLGAEVVFNHADYRLLSARALEALAQFPESNLYLRGLIPLIGYPSTTVEYERKERVAGKTHYPLKKMIALALDGVTSLSIKPLRIITGIGITFSGLSLIAIIWVLISTILGNTVAGWASTMCAVGLIGGLQLLCLGVIGEYIGKIYLEVKNRPRFIIAERTKQNYKD